MTASPTNTFAGAAYSPSSARARLSVARARARGLTRVPARHPPAACARGRSPPPRPPGAAS
eukprot:4767598-Pleurochrysis_carterae.AAC.1